MSRRRRWLSTSRRADRHIRRRSCHRTRLRTRYRTRRHTQRHTRSTRTESDRAKTCMQYPRSRMRARVRHRRMRTRELFRRRRWPSSARSPRRLQALCMRRSRRPHPSRRMPQCRRLLLRGMCITPRTTPPRTTTSRCRRTRPTCAHTSSSVSSSSPFGSCLDAFVSKICIF